MSVQNVYRLDGRVPLSRAIPLGIQHVMAMFLGNVSPLLIICGMLNMDVGVKTSLIQNSMFIAGVVTLIQLYPIWKVGCRLPVVMGTSSGFIGTCKSIGSNFGYGAIIGASLTGAILEIILGFFIKPLKKLFPPVVTSLVIMSIGLSLLPVGINYFAGGSGAPDFGHWKHLLVGLIVVVVIVVLKQFTKGFLSVSAILIGIIVGYLAAIALDMVDFQPIADAAWFSLPKPIFLLDMRMEFHWQAMIAMAIMFVATAVETVGNISGITNGGLDREPTNEELSGGVIADGAGSLLAALFGVLPNTSFSQNVGLVTMTRIVNRMALACGAVFLVLCGLLPKLAALVSIMPQSVLGGAAVIMFSSIVMSGIQLITSKPLTPRSMSIVAVALGLGYGLGANSAVLVGLPQWVQLVFGGSGIVPAAFVAIVMNLLLPREKEA